MPPVAGRLVAFTSGLENFHRAESISWGSRHVLGLWFSRADAFNGSALHVLDMLDDQSQIGAFKPLRHATAIPAGEVGLVARNLA